MPFITDPFTAAAAASTAGFRAQLLSAQPGSPVVSDVPRSPRPQRGRLLAARVFAAAARRLAPAAASGLAPVARPIPAPRMAPVDARQVACTAGTPACT